MKKIMIVAAIVCAAVCSQGSSIMWNLLAGDGEGGTLNTAGYHVYICADIASFASEAAISSHLLGTGGNTATLEEGMGGMVAGDKINGLPSYEAGSVVMQPFYYVIVDDKSAGYWTYEGESQLFTSESSHTDSDLDVSSLMTTANMTAFGGSPTPTPEPTSGLLLVLGIAGLALRRKQK